jgi:malate dehydrogenase (oxaloacetate-decarboxylating)
MRDASIRLKNAKANNQQAEAISNYSHLFRRSEGLFLAFPDQDMMEEAFLEQTRGKEIDLIVVTDAEAILGIGDQGVGVRAIGLAINDVI